MDDLQAQLEALRRRVARINLKYAAGTLRPGITPAAAAAEPAPAQRPHHYFADEFLCGQVVATREGEHFETEKLYERTRRHGNLDLVELENLPTDLLLPLSGYTVRPCPPQKWAFLDTETTGLAGGAGTVAFLVGVGRVAPDGFRVRQFFMRDYAEEASMLCALQAHLEQFDVLVTYNGRTYDQPLLETRFHMVRQRPPFERLDHLDLLQGARRLWKLRLDSCRLTELEYRILGVERQGDLPGEMIPYVYFEYVRKREALRLAPVFHHNAMDILTLACLAAIVPWAYRDPANAPLRHGADFLGLARWCRQVGLVEQAAMLHRRALEAGLPDELLGRALWDLACLERRRDREEAFLGALRELVGFRNPYQVKALEALAKHCEHKERNYAQALEWTRQALALVDSEALRQRRKRIERRLGRPQPGRLV